MNDSLIASSSKYIYIYIYSLKNCSVVFVGREKYA